MNARDIRRLSKVLAHYLDPDGLEPEDEKAKAKRGAWLRPNGDGTQTLRWTETDENIALLQAALEPLSGPVPGAEGEKDTRSPALRRADGLVDLVSQTLRHGDLPTSRGARPHLVVTVTEQALLNGHGLGITATGEHLSAEAVRRISCDADLTAIRLDTNGVPLSLGRTRRIVSPQQWLALVARDHGCVFPNCTRPAAWTQAHHLVHWSQGGPTDLENLALVATGITTRSITTAGTSQWPPTAGPNYAHRPGPTQNVNPDATGTGRPKPTSTCADGRRPHTVLHTPPQAPSIWAKSGV